MTENESSSFNLNCFDDDFENIKHIEEINEYYEYLETNDYIDLNWKCPGRKSMQKTEEKDSQVLKTPAKESSQKMEFDFEDEKDSTSVKLNQLRTPKNLSSGPKTLTANKTTFNSVMKKLKKRN